MKKFILACVGLSLGWLSMAFSAPPQGDFVFRLPPFSHVEIPGVAVHCDAAKGRYRIDGFTNPLSYPFPIKISGPFGGFVERQIASAEDLRHLNIGSGRILDSDPKPKSLVMLPEICPRVRLENPSTETRDPRWCDSRNVQVGGNPGALHGTYRGNQDPLNHRPRYQMLDPDFSVGSQPLSVSAFDGKNTLQVKRAHLTNDYEDDARIDYRGPDPKTGRERVVHEGTGGFYSNIHFAVLPYDPRIKNLDPQTLMALVHGELLQRGHPELRPEIRTHSFLPGPFGSQSKMMYQLCEWGDTQFQSPDQSLDYEGLALWDWDFPVKNPGHVLLVFWEEDEEQGGSGQEFLPEFYSRDDLIALFEVKRSDTLKELTLRNPEQDFEITLKTGDL